MRDSPAWAYLSSIIIDALIVSEAPADVWKIEHKT